MADGDEVEPVEITSEDGLNILRHSTAHVMAQAVQELFPEAKLGIGPPIKDGFYYDFDVEKPFTPEDLKAIEKKMQEIQKRGQRFSRRVVTDEARPRGAGRRAVQAGADRPQGLRRPTPTRARTSRSARGELTIYDNLDAKTGELCWKDLCRGPHLPTTRQHPGVQADAQRRRVLARQREEPAAPAHLRHRLADQGRAQGAPGLPRRGREARPPQARQRAGPVLHSRSEIGSGLAVFHPKGGIIRRVMEDYSRRRHEEEGYEFVYTPHATKGKLFETSGHLDWYADGMYPPMQLDEGVDYYLKPMNCPMHNLIFDARGRSYRELPLRLFEFGTVYRYEKSGVVHGLTRARGFTQDDAHIYCTTRADGGRARQACSPSSSTCCATTA